MLVRWTVQPVVCGHCHQPLYNENNDWLDDS